MLISRSVKEIDKRSYLRKRFNPKMENLILIDI
jgi:hypothetical protein